MLEETIQCDVTFSCARCSFAALLFFLFRAILLPTGLATSPTTHPPTHPPTHPRTHPRTRLPVVPHAWHGTATGRLINVQLLVRLAEAPLLSGNLSKLGGSHGGRENWKVRYFVLDDDALAYYESEKAYNQGAEPKGVIQVRARTARSRMHARTHAHGHARTHAHKCRPTA